MHGEAVGRFLLAVVAVVVIVVPQVAAHPVAGLGPPTVAEQTRTVEQRLTSVPGVVRASVTYRQRGLLGGQAVLSGSVWTTPDADAEALLSVMEASLWTSAISPVDTLGAAVRLSDGQDPVAESAFVDPASRPGPLARSTSELRDRYGLRPLPPGPSPAKWVILFAGVSLGVLLRGAGTAVVVSRLRIPLSGNPWQRMSLGMQPSWSPAVSFAGLLVIAATVASILGGSLGPLLLIAAAAAVQLPVRAVVVARIRRAHVRPPERTPRQGSVGWKR
ncbi:hypothetical protein GB931_10090 [Modestobacter sp. I12A-02628]|uniref:Uncharacterized protein n=1 Tax=Goekera deserti TaxID=2497753 RepID=A0A7K3WBT0_9ACTN|nr:hypothetical protein [Goekera deserti]MPQ98259.1 hypothetical protein [Goekera deserti]NDI48085.1 hypothetical protein [Goekera deserti]NEL53834.1 hypothetical protein [Goekera deserti]